MTKAAVSPIALLRDIYEAPDGIVGRRAWAGLYLLAQIFLENEGISEQLSKVIGPTDIAREMLSAEDAEVCRLMAHDGSLATRELVVTFLLFTKVTCWTAAMEDLCDEGARRLSQTLPAEGIKSYRAAIDELALEVWRDRISDIRQASTRSTSWREGFYDAIACLFIAAEPGPGTDPEEWRQRAHNVAPNLSASGWRYCEEAVRESQTNSNTREAVLSIMLYIGRTVCSDDPTATYEQCAEIAEGLDGSTVARCGKRAEAWCLSEDRVSRSSDNGDRTEDGYQEDEELRLRSVNLIDPTDEYDWEVLFLLSLIYPEFAVHDGRSVLAEEPCEPVEFCHVHALAISHHMVVGESGGWSPEVIRSTWILVRDRSETTTEALAAFLLFRAQECRNDAQFDNWGSWMWRVELVAGVSGLDAAGIERARVQAERLYPAAHAVGLDRLGSSDVILGPWRLDYLSEPFDVEQALGFDLLMPRSQQEYEFSVFVAIAYMMTTVGCTGVVWFEEHAIPAGFPAIQAIAQEWNQVLSDDELQAVERLITERAPETTLTMLSIGLHMANLDESGVFRSYADRLSDHECISANQLEACEAAAVNFSHNAQQVSHGHATDSVLSGMDYTTEDLSTEETAIFANSAYSNPYWTDSIENEDAEVIRNEMNRRLSQSSVEQLWHSVSQVRLSRLYFGSDYPCHELSVRSFARFNTWLQGISSSDPRLHTEIKGWLHQEELNKEAQAEKKRRRKETMKRAGSAWMAGVRSWDAGLQKQNDQRIREREEADRRVADANFSYQQEQTRQEASHASQDSGHSGPTTCLWSGCNLPGITHTPSGWLCGLHTHHFFL